MIPEVNITLKSLERWFGPYPFYEDGFKMVDAPYVGMEHQSAIAYGRTYMKGTDVVRAEIFPTQVGVRKRIGLLYTKWLTNGLVIILQQLILLIDGCKKALQVWGKNL